MFLSFVPCKECKVGGKKICMEIQATAQQQPTPLKSSKDMDKEEKHLQKCKYRKWKNKQLPNNRSRQMPLCQKMMF